MNNPTPQPPKRAQSVDLVCSMDPRGVVRVAGPNSLPLQMYILNEAMRALVKRFGEEEAARRGPHIETTGIMPPDLNGRSE